MLLREVAARLRVGDAAADGVDRVGDDPDRGTEPLRPERPRERAADRAVALGKDATGLDDRGITGITACVGAQRGRPGQRARGQRSLDHVLGRDVARCGDLHAERAQASLRGRRSPFT